MRMRLIDADKLDWWYRGRPIRRIIDEAPTVDAVPRGVLDQVRWERDVAMKQLEEHGIPFCGIAPDVTKVVRCKNCENRGVAAYCPMCFEEFVEHDYDGYHDSEYLLHDHTTDDGFCDRGERGEGE